ncbi:glycosyl transferase family 2 [Lacinutrix venerupis]|uniref:glycosyltransferase family 2 protein n=1 Tax=Lacinutrix venerupis TaxID=1486034 RepID=UPI000EB3F176|nr:glycosyltransferase [Lacinutrix venerupis]RLJ64373.1 glycosyl transferase family 2 [Lacinutrix venerupis]
MDKDVLVSIIIPNYNSAKFIQDTILSIKNQTSKNWECIIVDDGSTDNSLLIINNNIVNDARFKLYKRPQNLVKGGNSCRNYGFEKSNGALINWFDSDDVMHPDFIEKKVSCFFKNNNLDFVVSGGDFVDKDLNLIKKMPIYDTNNVYKEYFFWRLKIVTNAVMFKKSFLKTNELFKLDLTKGQEFELFTRLFYKNDKYNIITDSLYSYRSHPNSISSKSKSYIPENKYSETYTVFQNLKRNLKEDSEITQSCFRLLITMYRKSLSNNDRKNINYIEKNLEKLDISNKKLVINVLRFVKKMPLIFNSLAWNKIIYRIKIA